MANTRKRIMLVDDDQSSRQQGRAILKEMYEVYPLPSAHKLFEILEIFMPHLILLDIHMPVVDGFETIKRLKNNKRYEHIPVIFLTAANDKESVLKGRDLGAAGFVTKPFSASDLRAHIENCFNTHDESAASEDVKVRADKPVILAIDDSPDVLRMIHSILKDSYKVYTLPRPDKLADLLGKVTPELFLLDYRMPEISGFDLIPVIRGYPEHENTPIIFLTSEGTIDNLSAAICLGARDFIVKPFDMVVLREKIARHFT